MLKQAAHQSRITRLEGHRRYIESLSAYARLFLGRIEKPDIDDIKGISPAIAIEQKVNSSNPRSTVGTTTEIYDYLKLLYARIGKTFSPVSNEIVSKDSPESILNYILHLPKDSKLIISCPVTVPKGREIEDQVNLYLHQGYSKIWKDGNIVELNEDINSEHFEIIIDRIKNDDTAENQSRILDSLELAFHEGKGMCNIINFQNGKTKIKNFNNLFSKDGIVFEEPNLDFFSFNSPYGACKRCEGFGKITVSYTHLTLPTNTTV